MYWSLLGSRGAGELVTLVNDIGFGWSVVDGAIGWGSRDDREPRYQATVSWCNTSRTFIGI